MIKWVGQPPKQCPPGRWGPTRPDEPITDVPSLARRVPRGGRISLWSQTCRKADAWGTPNRSSSPIAEYRRLKCARRSRCRATHYAQYGGGDCPLPAPGESGSRLRRIPLGLFDDVSNTRIAEDKTVLFSPLTGALAESGNQALAAYFGYRKFNFRTLGRSDEFLFEIA
jgi:hypothetical protein